MPAAPPPTITTSVSLLATFQSAVVCKDKRRLRRGAYDDRPSGWRLLWCIPARPLLTLGYRRMWAIIREPKDRGRPFTSRRRYLRQSGMSGSARTLRRSNHDLVR
jgi:hypothetical protein